MSHLERSFRCPKCGGISPVNAFWDRPYVLMTLEDEGIQCLHCDAEYKWECLVTVFGLPRDMRERHYYQQRSDSQLLLGLEDSK
jgi:hypothetical protein